MRQRMRLGILCSVLLATGCSLTDKREIRRVAYEAVKAAPEMPAGGRPAPMRQCRVFHAKNAASVDVPLIFSQPPPPPVPRSFMVWVKRIGTRWQLDGYVLLPLPDGHPERSLEGG